jgi:hypothetical protein
VLDLAARGVVAPAPAGGLPGRPGVGLEAPTGAAPAGRHSLTPALAAPHRADALSAPASGTPLAPPDAPTSSAFSLFELPSFAADKVAPQPTRADTVTGGGGVGGPGGSGVSGFGVAASSPVPPPMVVAAILVALLCLSMLGFGRLTLAPARWRPVAFVSLLERPG